MSVEFGCKGKACKIIPVFVLTKGTTPFPTFLALPFHQNHIMHDFFQAQNYSFIIMATGTRHRRCNYAKKSQKEKNMLN